MSDVNLSDRSITCPHCHAENEVAGSDLPANLIIRCSSCGSAIGRISETRDRFVELKAARPDNLHTEPQAQGTS